MAWTVDEIFTQALQLPDKSKESLAERLVAFLATSIDPDVSRRQLEISRRRRDEVRSGEIEPLDGEPQALCIAEVRSPCPRSRR